MHDPWVLHPLLFRARIQKSHVWCRCMEEGDAARAQAMAEAKIALDKVTAELSAWLFAQNDCAVRLP